MDAKRQNVPIERLNRIAWLLDNSIPLPGLKYRIVLVLLIAAVVYVSIIVLSALWSAASR